MIKQMSAMAAVSRAAVLAAASHAEGTASSPVRVSGGAQTLEVGEAQAYGVSVGQGGEAVVRAHSDGWIGLFVYDGSGHLVDWALEEDGDLECELRPLLGEALTLRVVNLDGHEVAFELETTAEELERHVEPPRDARALRTWLR